MKSIEEFFSPCTSVLHHYTSVGALIEIAKSQSFHAGNAYFQNDSEEVAHASSIVENVLRKRERHASENERRFLEQFRNSLDFGRRIKYGIFIFSLSENGNQLSQWRGYTPHGRGVSVGLSPAFVNAIAKSNKLKLAKCLYAVRQKEELAGALIEKMLESFRNAGASAVEIGAPNGEEYSRFIEKFRGNLLQVFSIMKHPSFSEEREWRLISSFYESFSDRLIDFKDGSLGLTPYLEIKFPKARHKSEKKPFSYVYSGPSADPELSFSALHEFVSKYELSDQTKNSGIPFRKM